ncbi:MAG: biopolymer transporter ExbD [Muricauda sp.]|nr:biopolymer transporter ExbD [Allomuricauda sp.]MBC32280.1 biopolymer transporter ExbD [Allomuricauda sp.]|tara:strand:+ start:56443 stop:56916 length:474 start_codon:yes stop_codon:yes gene_type:complete
MRIDRSTKNRPAAISTASLPDIVFILLFFFMTVTTIKTDTLLVANELPIAEEVGLIENEELIIEILVGRPSKELSKLYGDQPAIQLNDRLAKIEEVAPFVLTELSKKPNDIRNKVIVSLKIDKKANVGLVQDIKEELSKINLLKVNYATLEGPVHRN